MGAQSGYAAATILIYIPPYFDYKSAAHVVAVQINFISDESLEFVQFQNMHH